MIILFKIALITVCGIIAYQDFKERAVVWTIFPITASLFFSLHISHAPWQSTMLYALSNCLLVSTVLSILFLYSRLILKKRFLDVSLGLGDVLFFYAFALGFPTMTFVLLFVGAIFFSLLVFLVLKMGRPMETVPLAGLMGLFVVGVLVSSLFPNTPSLYIL
ncbi:hypothetical protein [Pricia sp.]|uniref:hypothetical protein n=1 Tax=Pricia sp. TaxID=2268138 RepID=UPI0035941BD6